MSESEPPQRNRSATIQIDAVDDLELLGMDAPGEAGPSLPPPLPPKGSRPPSAAPSVAPSQAPSQAPPAPRSPMTIVMIAVVGLAAGGLGIYLATTLLADDPEPEPAATTLEIGDIHISTDE